MLRRFDRNYLENCSTYNNTSELWGQEVGRPKHFECFSYQLKQRTSFIMLTYLGNLKSRVFNTPEQLKLHQRISTFQ